jgi:ABC-type nitrate/sulfonate/bicarbonate transport system substrate-binding protein
MKKFALPMMLIPLIGIFTLAIDGAAADKVTLAYVSDSPASSAAYWVANDAGLFKKHGLDVDMIFVNGSTRSVQSLVAGDCTLPERSGLPP